MQHIDPADFIEAPEGANALRFDEEKKQAKFELGVCMAIYKWDELNTAVENSWGGPNSAEKRDWISGIIIELFDDKIVDIALIEETLLYAMLDEFDTNVDNDSALEIGAMIVKMYRDVQRESYGQIDDLYAQWLVKQENKPQTKKIELSTEADTSSSDEEGEENATENLKLHQERSSDLANEGDQMDVDNGPVIDDDGFELVTRRGHKRRN